MRGLLPVRLGTRPYYSRPLNGISGGRIHYTAGATYNTVNDIARYQVGPNAQEEFPAIAYHYLVEGDGTPNHCHNLSTRVWGSGQPGSNEIDVHVCYTGFIGPNWKQIYGIAAAILDAETILDRSIFWRGHKDGYSTTCPGSEWPIWWSKVGDILESHSTKT